MLIWGDSRNKFGTPESEYKGKHICVTGKIAEYKIEFSVISCAILCTHVQKTRLRANQTLVGI